MVRQEACTPFKLYKLVACRIMQAVPCLLPDKKNSISAHPSPITIKMFLFTYSTHA
jgi:hypothetical protein